MTIMAEDRIQLKNEEVVGNEVVLSDINPKSNTKSIDDPSTGASLDKTLERMWNAINNKLSRVVNSVNGRTGVVVLDSSDVGLSKVDNVSFSEIKQWVISRISQEFGFKRIEMFNSLVELDETINNVWLHDEIYAGKPFYAHHGYENNGVTDDRGYIGYIYYDAGRLKHTEMVLDTIGSADNSIVYNETGSHNVDYSETGRVGVNIWNYEDALEVYNDASGLKARSGLRINKDNVSAKLYWFDGVYGNGNEADADALLYFGDLPSGQAVKTVDIYIDNTLINYTSFPSQRFGGVNYIKQNFKVNDIIICNFNDEQYLQDVDTGIDAEHPYDRVIDKRMNPLLMLRKPCIGKVTKAPTPEHPEYNYEIKFFSIKIPTYRGIKYENIHTGSYDYDDQSLSVDLLNSTDIRTKDGDIIYVNQNGIGISGLNAMYPYNTSSLRTVKGVSSKRAYQTILPSGLSRDIYENDTSGLCNEVGSMYILPNYSLCVIPYSAHTDINNHVMPNWPITGPPLPNEPNIHIGDNGNNMIGINLVKSLNVDSREVRWATNVSGLRIITDDEPLDSEWFGNNDSSTVTNHSGGLSVNVGSFLEIGSSDGTNAVYKTKVGYYDEGKVNVRIDTMKGLYDVLDQNELSTNALGINLANGQYDNIYNDGMSPLEGGLKFVSKYTGLNATHGLLSVNTGRNSGGLAVKNNVVVKEDFSENGDTTPSNIITEDSVLCVNPYVFTSQTKTIDKSGLEIHKLISEEDLAELLPDNIVEHDRIWERKSDLETAVRNAPENFDEDHIYIAGGKRYIIDFDTNPSGNEVIPYILYYSYRDRYYEIIDDINDNIDDPSMSLLKRQLHVLIEPSDVVDVYTITGTVLSYTSDDLRLPDVNNDGILTADTVNSDDHVAARLLADYNSIHTNIYISDRYSSVYYTDPACQTPLTDPEQGVLYEVKNWTDVYPEYTWNMLMVAASPQIGGLVYYMPEGYSQVMSPAEFEKMCNSADVDRNYKLSSTDTSAIRLFVQLLFQNTYGTIQTPFSVNDVNVRSAWVQFLKEYKGIIIGDGRMNELFSYKYEKGLRVRYNEKCGITYNPEYVGGTIVNPISRGITTEALRRNSIKSALSIKIADPSAGIIEYDETIHGGLRFCAGGYLGIRINNNNGYNAVLPSNNTQSCVDDLSTGLRGLHIYDQNILGVQLTTNGGLDNGKLMIDTNGCLTISNNYNPIVSLSSLNISGSTAGGSTETVSYSGSEEITIELGPGLCFG